MKKCVNGEYFDMTPEEIAEAERLAQEEAERRANADEVTAEQILADLEAIL